MKPPKIDTEAMRRAILAELSRQGVEFAELHLSDLFHDGRELQFTVMPLNREQIQPKYLDSVRVANQVAKLDAAKAAAQAATPEPVNEQPGLSVRHYKELIVAATNDRPGWVPAGPMDAARTRKLKGPYSRPNILAELEKMGLLEISGAGKNQYTIRLTLKGAEAVATMPDDLHAEIFPLPQDIAEAKKRMIAGGVLRKG